MAILYVGTNFPVSIAKGQDAKAGEFLASFPAGSRLVMPAFCFAEALSVLETEQAKFRAVTEATLTALSDDAGQDLTSSFAEDFARNLKEARSAGAQRINHIRSRLDAAIGRLVAIAEFIPFSPELLMGVFDEPILDDPTDQWILASILDHAGRHPGEPKALLSRDYKAFDGEPSRERLKDAGVQFCRSAHAASGWLSSQSPAGA